MQNITKKKIKYYIFKFEIQMEKSFSLSKFIAKYMSFKINFKWSRFWSIIRYNYVIMMFFITRFDCKAYLIKNKRIQNNI